MFTTLWHYPFVCSNYEEHKVDPAGSGKHIFYKSLMSGDINNTDYHIIGIPEVCKSQVNCDAPFFFLFQPVRVNAGQCPDQGTFPMINVSSSTENYMTHFPSLRRSFSLPSRFIKVTVGRKKMKSW